MELTIKEAAALLGKPPRTVRWLAQQGKLPAQRVAGRWVIDSRALEAGQPALAESRRTRAAEVRQRLATAMDEAMPPAADGERRGFYSVRDMATWQTGAALAADIEALRVSHPDAGDGIAAASDAMRRFLHHLADGCHQYHPATKLDRLVAARSAACRAAAELLRVAALRPGVPVDELVDRIEKDLLGRLRGVLRRVERRRRQ